VLINRRTGKRKTARVEAGKVGHTEGENDNNYDEVDLRKSVSPSASAYPPPSKADAALDGFSSPG
jgi:hypothetical protein